MTTTISSRTIVAATAIILGALPLATRAQSPAAVATAIPCAMAVSAMTGRMPTAAPAMAAATATDVDATYKIMMTAHAHAMLGMAQLEMRCGNDAKAKAAAANQQRILQSVLNTLQIF